MADDAPNTARARSWSIADDVPLTRHAGTGRRRWRVPTRSLRLTGNVIGLYLVVRGIAEAFLIDPFDARSYRSDWGGPSLLGVLAVHCLPGLVVLTYATARYLDRTGRNQDRGVGG